MRSKIVTRLGVLALALAVVLVPAMARARQRVERRDATRLSITHNWLGVAPPTKTIVFPQPVVMLPSIAVEPGPRPAVHIAPVVSAPARRPSLDRSPDPLRGPPSLS